MIKINIICVGKIKEDYFTNAVKEYLKRLSKFALVNIIEVSEEKISDNPSEKEILIVKEKEGDRLLSKIKDKDYVIALTLSKNELTSEEFASKIKNIQNKYNSISFIIGGSYGLCDTLLNKVNYQLTFSKMTFPHQLFRVILLEQIYRSFKINNNENYHK